MPAELEADPPALRFRSPWPRLRERFADAPELLLCLDFDGTLAPIVPDPADAELLPGAREQLARLADEPSVTVAVVSGRSLADLRERVGVEGVVLAGNHGLELGDAGDAGDDIVDPDAAAEQAAVARAVATLRDALADVPGCEVEDKGLTATVHYRRTPDERVPEVREAVESTVAAAEGLRLTEGKEILEVRPDVPGGKDRAVRRLLERHPEALPVFVGDDVTDEDAFRALPPDGVAVLVGDREDTAATLRVGDPEGAVAFLRWVADVRAGGGDGD
jgi:trehalose 6-phosphate phosphatase